MNFGVADDDAADDMIAPLRVHTASAFEPPPAALLLMRRAAEAPEKEDTLALKGIDKARIKPLNGG